MAGDAYVLGTLDEGGPLGPVSLGDGVGLRWETGECVPCVLGTLDEGGPLGPVSFDYVGLRWETGEYVPYVPTGHQYEGPYEVTPTLSEQSLETRNRTMTDDVTVHAVPLYEVGNEWGTTVYIATLEG